MTHRQTCPQRTVVTIHSTTKTWLPVTLSCGHVEQINWTASKGEKLGCIACAEAIEAVKAKAA